METTIVLPSKPRIVSEEKDRGVYEIDGLYPGYGHVLGNSLRRILLSSLPGVAPTRVKIEGVFHEFSTIPGVKEDVIAILLNLKKLRFKMTTDELQVVRLRVKGVRIVTAKDLELPGQVEVANPGSLIATLTEKDAVLAIELVLEKGLGYVTREVLQKEKAEVGEMILDASFTPIRRVNYEVENMRVGDRTDFNRLRLMIQTDETITPHQALEEAITIMIHQLKAIIGFKEPVEEIAPKEEPVVEEVKETEKPTVKDDKDKIRIEELNMSNRVANALREANIRTVGGLVRRTNEDLLSLEGIGEKGLQDIKRALGRLGLVLKD
ncbi:DNA-directed RNA polymerase subunit alpha [Patescibacteria group bacterium]|nr:DNA-directed RNA polymerase subunit alpha [Patescibacteria group bacterium]